jgi:uncharacterized protein YecE (DUF72 family)
MTETQAALPVQVGKALARCGAGSWADRGLVKEGDFYPRKTMKAAERLAYYASRLPVVEVSSTHRFPPTPDLARQWVERTPEGFVFDIQAWSLLTGLPTFPDSLWEDMREAVRPEVRDRRRLYPDHLVPSAMDEAWTRFHHALLPLHDAGRLGVVTLTYPSWFTPKDESRYELASLEDRLPGFRLAVELRSPKWLAGDACEDTLAVLEDLGLAFVCTDITPDLQWSVPPVVAATADTAVVRFRGRAGTEEDPWPWPYRYADDELSAWVPRVEELAASASDIHLVFTNTWRDDAVANAIRMGELLVRDADH